ncbi:cAMP-activated global transcriptional regulator CRP [Luteimonas sp. e5]
MTLPSPLSLALRQQTSALAPDAGVIERFLAHTQRRRFPSRSDVFRPGDPAGTMYYVVEGSVSIIAEEEDDRELILGYFGPGEFIGEMSLFTEPEPREVTLRTRVATDLAEIDTQKFQQLLTGALAADATRLMYGIADQLSRRLRDTTRKASRLAFLDVTNRIWRTLHDLAREPDALSHPQGMQLRISRQELARLVGCSREMAGRVLKKLQADGKLHARGKTLVLYDAR